MPLIDDDMYIDVRFTFRRETHESNWGTETWTTVVPESVSRKIIHNITDEEAEDLPEAIWEHYLWQPNFVNGTLKALHGQETKFND